MKCQNTSKKNSQCCFSGSPDSPEDVYNEPFGAIASNYPTGGGSTIPYHAGHTIPYQSSFDQNKEYVDYDI